MVVAAAADTTRHHLHLHHQTTRPPLVPSERDNGGGAGGGEEAGVSTVSSSRKPKSRQVTSRYLSSSSSSSSCSSSSSSSSSASNNFPRRSTTPLASRTPLPSPSPSPAIKRSQSVERRRPVTPRSAVQLTDLRPNNAADNASVSSKILFTSTRSLAVSFQGESFSLPVSKIKPAPPPPQSLSSVRKCTPERRRNVNTPLRSGDQVENQHRWPGRSCGMTNSLSRSLDCSTGDNKKKFGGSGNVVRALQQSMINEDSNNDGRLQLVRSIHFPLDTDSIDGSVASSTVASDLVSSDTESVSSGGNSGVQESRLRNVPRCTNVSARFRQETSSRLRPLQEPGYPLSTTSPTGATMRPPKLISSKTFSVDSPVSSSRTVSSRGMSSPLRGPVRPASSSKLTASSAPSPSRGMPSPLRTRNSTGGPTCGGQLSNMPSVLSFSGGGKMGESRIMDAHQLRLSHNRQLQWRFVNARADAAMLAQRHTVEKNLYSAGITISELRDSVTVKRIRLQFLTQNLKLTSILKGQMRYLEECGIHEREHTSSLCGAIKALEASTLRLPVVGGARADIQLVKDAVNSAVDVMQAMASSICSSLSKVEQVNNLAAELAYVTRQEQALLDECKHLLSTLAAMQVTECSLRTHILQQNT